MPCMRTLVPRAADGSRCHLQFVRHNTNGHNRFGLPSPPLPPPSPRPSPPGLPPPLRYPIVIWAGGMLKRGVRFWYAPQLLDIPVSSSGATKSPPFAGCSAGAARCLIHCWRRWLKGEWVIPNCQGWAGTRCRRTFATPTKGFRTALAAVAGQSTAPLAGSLQRGILSFRVYQG